MPPRKALNVSKYDRIWAKAEYMKALRDCNNRVNSADHPTLYLSASQLNAIKEALEAETFSSFETKGSVKYRRSVSEYVVILENCALDLPGNVTAWELVVSRESAVTGSSSYQSLLAPQPRPVLPALMGTQHAAATSTSNSFGGINSDGATARGDTSMNDVSNVPSLGQAATATASSTSGTYNAINPGASMTRQHDFDGEDPDQEQNPGKTKKVAEDKPGRSSLDENVLFDEAALARNADLNAKASGQAPYVSTVQASGLSSMQQLGSTVSPFEPAKGKSPMSLNDAEIQQPQLYEQLPEEKMDISEVADASILQDRKVHLFKGFSNTTPAQFSAVPKFTMTGSGFLFNSTAKDPSQYMFGRTETAAHTTLPISNTTPAAAMLGQEKSILASTSSSASLPASNQQHVINSANTSLAPDYDMFSVPQNTEDAEMQDTTTFCGETSSSGLPTTFGANSETPTTQPSPAGDSQHSQMAAMILSLQNSFATMQTAQKEAEHKHVIELKTLSDKVQSIGDQNTGYALKIKELELQIQAEQAKTLEVSSKHMEEMANLTRKCDSFEKSNAAYEETSQRLYAFESATAAREQAVQEHEKAIAAREEAVNQQEKVLRDREEQNKLKEQQLNIAVREHAETLAQQDSASAAQQKLLVPKFDVPEKWAQLPMENTASNVETTQEATQISEEASKQIQPHQKLTQAPEQLVKVAEKAPQHKEPSAVLKVDDVVLTVADVYRKNMAIQTFLEPYDSNGNSASELDFRPRSSREPSPMFGPSSLDVASVFQRDPVNEVAKEIVRKHNPSKGSYGLDYGSEDEDSTFGDESEDAAATTSTETVHKSELSKWSYGIDYDSDQDDIFFECDETAATDDTVRDHDVTTKNSEHTTITKAHKEAVAYKQAVTKILIDYSALDQQQLRLLSSVILTSRDDIYAELVTLLAQSGMPENMVEDHATHLSALLHFHNGFAHSAISFPAPLHEHISTFTAKMDDVFSNVHKWLYDPEHISQLYGDMSKFSAIVHTFDDLANADRLLKKKELVPSMEVCVAYLRAVTALWESMPKGGQKKALHGFLKREDVRLRRKVNRVAMMYGQFVTDFWAIETAVE